MREPVFVVTSGRSGSVSLTDALNRHPLVAALHEPYRWMIEAAYLRAGEQRPVLDPGVWRWCVPQPAGNQVAVLVDQKLAPFVSDIASVWPGARWVWLVRDGRRVVNSAHVRGWYRDGEAAGDVRNPWAVWRLTAPLVGEMAPESWAAWTPFERCCWYWKWVNMEIERGLAGVRHWMQVRLEELADPGSAEVWWSLLDWLELPEVDRGEFPHLNRGPMTTLKVWTANQEAQFAERCGSSMDVLYPKWR